MREAALPMDLTIGNLNLSIDNARGHEHRIRPIVHRAGAILAKRLDEKYGDAGLPGRARDIRALAGAKIDLNFGRTTDEQAAGAIAAAWLEAIALHLEA
jgi:hypothetical protein